MGRSSKLKTHVDKFLEAVAKQNRDREESMDRDREDSYDDWDDIGGEGGGE